MKKLIIEAGATTSTWVLLDGHEVNTQVLIGWNATSSTTDLAQNELTLQWAREADEVFFFGAGVSTESAIKKVKNALKRNDAIAQSDLIAACIATLGNEKGIACILGTGSMTCYWDGAKAEVITPSLGYLIGDEGSGSDIGRELLRCYYYNEMPSDLKIKFEETYGITYQDTLYQLYKGDNPKSYLAQFSKFVSLYPHEWSRNLVKQRLELFFNKRVTPIFHKKTQKIGFVGSVGFVFKDILIDICHLHKLEDITIYPSAIDGLIKHYQS